MENPQTPSPSQTLEPAPTPSLPASTSPWKNIAILFAVLFLSLGSGVAGYFFGVSQTQTGGQPVGTSQTPTVSPSPQSGTVSTKVANIQGSLQDYLKQYCKPSAPNESYVIDFTDLPLDEKSSVFQPVSQIKQGQTYCLGIDTKMIGKEYVSFTTADDTGVIIYDDKSEELGHGGPPGIGLFGKPVLKEGDVTITSHITGGSGPLLLGDMGLALRGRKEFVTKTGDKFYVNVLAKGISGKDPALMEFLKPYSRPFEGSQTNEMEVGFTTGKDLEGEMVNYFFVNSKPGSAEYQKVQTLKQELGKLQPK